jgi:hypothetical protein
MTGSTVTAVYSNGAAAGVTCLGAVGQAEAVIDCVQSSGPRQLHEICLRQY